MADLFEPDEEYTTAQKLREVDREIGFRRYVYPRRVAAGKMKQDAADYQIAVFEAIAADYRKRL
jgi:hypothetical protein